MLKVGEVVTYTLPQYKDPDEADKVSLTIDLGEAINYSKFDTNSMQLKFEPKIGSRYKAMYSISISLTDDNI